MEENVRPVAPAPAPAGPGAAKRGGWIPLAVAAAGILAFVWLASLLTPSAEPPPPGAAAATTVPDPTDPPTTSPPVGTTTPPPTLLQLVPGLQGGLTAIYADPDAPAIGSATWSRHLAAPTPSNPTGVRGWDLAAAFDRSGQDLAVLDSGTLTVGEPPMTTPIALGVTGWAWHGTRPRLLAWTARAPGSSETRLFSTEVAGAIPVFLGDPSFLTDHGTVPAGARLAGWGDWGFALNITAPPETFLATPTDVGGSDALGVLMTQLLAPDATPGNTIAGETLATGPDGMLVLRSTVLSLATALVVVDAATLDLPAGPTVDLADLTGAVDPASPSTVVVVMHDLEESVHVLISAYGGASFEGVTYRFDPTGEMLVAATTLGTAEPAGSWGRVTVTRLYQLNDPRRRPTAVIAADTILGFDRTGRWLLLSADEGSTIVFHDLYDRHTYRVPFPLGPLLTATL